MRIVLLCLLFLVPAAELDAQQWSWPERAQNLQVLPADFPGSRIGAVMRGFTRSLGVRCSHCHVGEEGQPLSTYDFASDDNRNKVTARAMLNMLGDINDALDTIEPNGERINMWCHTCHRGTARPGTLQEVLMMTYRADGGEAMLAQYASLRERYYGRGAYDFGENSLNAAGYEVLGLEDYDTAIALFRLNVEHFPQSSNAYDSLAEAYMESGNNELAEIFYRKALELDPNNSNSLEMLRTVKAH
ncbi:MAG: c-type cytochrome [Rhodothermales bacterium]|nr:c-type cytochrome [Rhodothermales bacterium]MBO6779303.1 c-type cytochrome [Rhodothermales bacterium]